MWQDIELWNTEKKRISKQKSIRLCKTMSDPKRVFLNFKVKQGGFIFGDNPKILHGWGNTSALAIQLAINLGCSNIVLLGTDCKYKGQKLDIDNRWKCDLHTSYFNTGKKDDRRPDWEKIPPFGSIEDKLR